MTEYNELTPELISQLQAIVGEEDCHVGENISEDYSHDEMPIYGAKMPEAVCFPGNTEEVAAIMGLCNENKIPVTVRGAGTGLVGGSTPLQGGVVLCTMHMNEILEYDMNNLFVRVQPGVRLCDLAADALEHDLMYPPDPGEKTGSLGGNVSTNAGGMRAVKYGTTRDYVLAMTVVLPTGEIMEIGRAVSKTSSGYSLLHLMIGSEGTLGVITELTLKLIPVPKEDISFILPFEDLETAISAVPKIKLAGLDPQSIEFMERDIVDSSADYTGNKIIPTNVDGHEVGAYILVTLDGNDQDEIFQRAETLAEIGDELAEFLEHVHQIGEKYGVGIRSFGHAGDGNLHIYASANGVDQDVFLEKSQKVMKESYEKCTELNGQVSGEHGIGHAKKEYLHDSVGDTAIGLMAGIKRVFDPNYILNPGKVCN